VARALGGGVSIEPRQDGQRKGVGWRRRLPRKKSNIAQAGVEPLMVEHFTRRAVSVVGYPLRLVWGAVCNAGDDRNMYPQWQGIPPPNPRIADVATAHRPTDGSLELRLDTVSNVLISISRATHTRQRTSPNPPVSTSLEGRRRLGLGDQKMNQTRQRER